MDASGFDAPRIDHAERRIEDAIPLARGAGHYDQRMVTVDTRVAAGGLELGGGYRLNRAGLAVLAWLLAGALLWLFVKAKTAGRVRGGRDDRSVSGAIVSHIRARRWRRS